ncbi:LysR substrate-binding domain-containing protein [Shimia sp.]|uniref:LysR family transcriptional regulator n=1 Tax=Shimia sp. TaxID=1954381 RepID=UPI003B8C3AAA
MRAYVAVADSGSFVGAAQRLSITPQLVSKYVRTLEDQLSAQLFIRSTRSVRLTETGAAYLGKCRQLLDDFEELTAAVRQDHRAPQGRLTIAAPTTYGEIHLADAIAEFALTYPRVEIDLRLSDRYVSLVDEGIDVAIRIGHLDDSSFVARKLSDAQLVYCATPHYLDRNGRPQRPEDLTQHSCVIDANFRAGDRWPFVVESQDVQITVSGRLRANSASAARRFALKNGGILLCPKYVVADDLEKGRLLPVLEQHWPQPLGVFAVYLENRHLSAKIRAFVDFMRQNLRQPNWQQNGD